MKLTFVLLGFVLLNCSFLFAEPPWKFIITGDSRSSGASVNNGVNTAILNEIAAEIVSHQVDFVLVPGDLVVGSTTQSTLQSQLTTWRTCMQPVYNAGIKVYAVRGNHDKGSLAAWNNVFSGSYAFPQNGPSGEVNLTYSVNHKNMLVLALDQYVNLMRVNQTWVDAQLAANTKPHIIALGHVPAFQVSHTDCLDDNVNERNAFWISLRNAGCKLYACGHDHLYDHAVTDDLDGNPDNNIHQLVVGSAGAPITSWSPPYDGVNSGLLIEQWNHREQFGYLLVEVLDDFNMRLIWYERDSTGAYMPLIGSMDLQRDSIVNVWDLMWLAQRWLLDECRLSNDFCGWADIDQSTNVDLQDFSYVAEQWQKSCAMEYHIENGNDDAEEVVSTGAIDLASTDLELVTDAAAQVIGMRFNNVAIPKNAQIASAYIQFTCDEAVNVNPCSLTFYAENSDNASAFTSAAYNLSSRPRTAGISGSPPDWTVMGEASSVNHRTPNLASLIESVVSRSGWQSGNSMAFIITGTGKRVAEAYEGVTTAAPKLYVVLE